MMRQCSVSAASAQNVGRPAQLRSWRTLSCLQDTVWVLTDCGSGAVTGSCVYHAGSQAASLYLPDVKLLSQLERVKSCPACQHRLLMLPSICV